jgi:hypothetical protein
MFWWQSLAASGTTIGFLSARSASGDTHLVAAFRQGLAEAPGVLAASQTSQRLKLAVDGGRKGNYHSQPMSGPGQSRRFEPKPARLHFPDDSTFSTLTGSSARPRTTAHLRSPTITTSYCIDSRSMPSPRPRPRVSPAQHTVARGRSLWGRIAVGHPPCDKSPMAALGQSRCFERALTTSELPRRPDSATQTGSSDEWSRMKIATGRYL